LLAFLAWFGAKSLGEIRAQSAMNGGLRTPLARPLQDAGWMRELNSSDLPIAVAPAVFYMTLQQYAPDAARSRIYYLADVERARRFGDIPSNDTNLLLFSRALPLRVVDFQEFVTHHSHFLVCFEAEHSNWLTLALLELKAQLQLKDRSGPYFIFEVTMP